MSETITTKRKLRRFIRDLFDADEFVSDMNIGTGLRRSIWGHEHETHIFISTPSEEYEIHSNSPRMFQRTISLAIETLTSIQKVATPGVVEDIQSDYERLHDFVDDLLERLQNIILIKRQDLIQNGGVVDIVPIEHRVDINDASEQGDIKATGSITFHVIIRSHEIYELSDDDFRATIGWITKDNTLNATDTIN